MPGSKVSQRRASDRKAQKDNSDDEAAAVQKTTSKRILVSDFRCNTEHGNENISICARRFTSRVSNQAQKESHLYIDRAEP